MVVVDALFRKGADLNLAWLRGQAVPAKLAFYRHDLADAAAVDAVFRRHAPFDYVCHLAGQVAMTTSLSDPRRDLMTNVLGTFNVLEAVRAHSPGRVGGRTVRRTRSMAIWSMRGGRKRPRAMCCPIIHRDWTRACRWILPAPTAVPRGRRIKYVRDWHRNYGLQTVVFRHSSIYGGRQFATVDQGWIGWFCQKALDQKNALEHNRAPEPFTISGTGKQVRDVLHAEDLVRLYQAAWEHRNMAAGQIFNIGGGMANSLSLLELFDVLETLLEFSSGTRLRYSVQSRRQSDQDVFVADIAKAARLLRWSPSVPCRDGIRRLLALVGIHRLSTPAMTDALSMNEQLALSVVIPAYLEEENLRLLLPRVKSTLATLGATHEILVVDTASPLDNTEAVCRLAGATHVRRSGGNAYGDAVRTGIARAQGRYLIFMDADGSHAPEYIPRLYQQAADYDMVVASRYVSGGATENPPLLIFMSRVLNSLYRVLLRIRCLDVSNSYKLYRAELLKSVPLACNNFDIIEEILIKCSLKKRDLRILEIPFTFKKRMFGQTKRSLFRFMLSFYWTLIKLMILNVVGSPKTPPT